MQQEEILELKARALELRKGGVTFKDIGTMIGRTTRTVGDWIKEFPEEQFAQLPPAKMPPEPIHPFLDIRDGCVRCKGAMLQQHQEAYCLQCGYRAYNVGAPDRIRPVRDKGAFNGNVIAVPRSMHPSKHSAGTSESVLIEFYRPTEKYVTKGSRGRPPIKHGQVEHHILCPYDREKMHYAANGLVDRLIDPAGTWHTAMLRCRFAHQVTIYIHGEQARWAPTPKGSGLRDEKRKSRQMCS